MNIEQISATDRQLVFHRLVNAPQELVFDENYEWLRPGMLPCFFSSFTA